MLSLGTPTPRVRFEERDVARDFLKKVPLHPQKPSMKKSVNWHLLEPFHRDRSLIEDVVIGGAISWEALLQIGLEF